MTTNYLNLVGSSAVALTMTTTVQGSAPLSAGLYGVWATGQTAYIAVTQMPISSNSTAATMYPILAALEPKVIVVPPNFSIASVSSSSGVFAYEKVGPWTGQ